MPTLDFRSRPNESSAVAKGPKIFLILAILASVVLGSTFAANINLTASGNERIEFGQGVTQTVVCGTSSVDVLLTVNSSFVNAPRSEGGGDFFFSSLTLSNIPDDCLGTTFKFRAYDESNNNPLQLSTCATNGRGISAYFNGENDVTPTGVTDSSWEDFGGITSVRDVTGSSFTLDWNGNCMGAPVSATDVFRVTVESERGAAPTVKSFAGHYYEYIDTPVSWNQAYDAVEVRNPDGSCKYVYRGLCGYLATITSGAENNFVTTKVGTAAAWLGGADHGGRNNDVSLCGGWDEGFWRWVSGPERCQRFSAVNNPVNGAVVGLTYENWNPDEPNDLGGEDALQIISGGSGQWNDLPQSGFAMGYIVEYSSNFTP